ncbi:MAG: O-antigen ligase family protein [Sedimentibacter sp.]
MNITKDKIYLVQNEGQISIEKLNNTVNLTVLYTLAVIPLVFVPLGGETDHFYLPKVIAMITLVLSFLLVQLKNKIKFSSFVKNDLVNKTLFIYFVLIALSVFSADNKLLAILGIPGRYEGLITIALYFMLFMIARLYNDFNDKLFLVVLITAIIVSIYGILQTFGIDPFPRDIMRLTWGKRAFATMGNPNFLGSYIVLVLPISIYLYIIKRNYIGLVGYIILFYCLLSTNTRGAWLGTIVSIICFVTMHYIYYKYNKAEFKRYIILFMITIIILLLYNHNSDGALLNRFLTITADAKEFMTDGERADYTGAHRGFIWKRVIELIKLRPLTGYGLENLGEVFLKYYSEDMIKLWDRVKYVDKAHNEYLHIAVSSGIPTLLVYLSFLLLIIRNGLMKLKSNDNLMLLLLSSVIGYMAAAFFNISVVSVAYIYWIFLGLIVSYRSNKLNV